MISYIQEDFTHYDLARRFSWDLVRYNLMIVSADVASSYSLTGCYADQEKNVST